jgi:hypothetical protein
MMIDDTPSNGKSDLYIRARRGGSALDQVQPGVPDSGIRNFKNDLQTD